MPAATGGARRSSASRRPVSAATAGWSGAPGLARVWKRSVNSSPRTRTAPISHGRAAAGAQPGRLEIEDDVGGVLEQQVVARGRRECDEVARPAQARVGRYRLVEQRPCEPGRHGAAELQHGPRRLVCRHRPAPVLDQLDEPIGSIEAQLHLAEATTNICSCPHWRRARKSRGPRRGRKDGSEVSCGSDLTHLSPRDARVPLLWRQARCAALVFRRSVLVERPARPSRAPVALPTLRQDTVLRQRRDSERPGSRRSRRRDGGPSLSPGPPSSPPFLLLRPRVDGPADTIPPRGGAARPSGPADPSLAGPGPPDWRPAKRPARAGCVKAATTQSEQFPYVARSEGPNRRARPLPGRDGSGRRFCGTLIADRPPSAASGSSSKRGTTWRCACMSPTWSSALGKHVHDRK